MTDNLLDKKVPQKKEETTVENETLTRKISVTFERKLGTEGYGNVTARAWVEASVEADASAAVISEALSDAFAQAKSAVYDELGIDVEMDAAGVIRETTPPVVSTQTRLAQEFGATPATGNSGGGYSTHGVEVANPDDMTQDIPLWLVNVCQEHGITKVWANTGKYGQFYKEYVAEGGEAKLGYEERNGKQVTKIISKPK